MPRPPHRGFHRVIVISTENDRWDFLSPKGPPGLPQHPRTPVTRRPRPVTVTPARHLRSAPTLHGRGHPQGHPYLRRTSLLGTPRTTHKPHKPRNTNRRAPRLTWITTKENSIIPTLTRMRGHSAGRHAVQLLRTSTGESPQHSLPVLRLRIRHSSSSRLTLRPTWTNIVDAIPMARLQKPGFLLLIICR